MELELWNLDSGIGTLELDLDNGIEGWNRHLANNILELELELLLDLGKGWELTLGLDKALWFGIVIGFEHHWNLRSQARPLLECLLLIPPG